MSTSPDQKGVVATMCMQPRRWPGSLKTVESLKGQVDTLYLCLNDFWEIPPELKQDWIHILHLGKNLGDVSRFYLLRNLGPLDAHVVSCDDDIVYPQSYVQDFLNAHKTYPDALLTHHGYTDGHFCGTRLHFAWSANMVHHLLQPGSGVSFIPQFIFNQMAFSSAVCLNHADIHLSCICQTLGVSIIGLPHKRGYIRALPHIRALPPKFAPTTLWGHFRKLSRSDQKALINKIRCSYGLPETC